MSELNLNAFNIIFLFGGIQGILLSFLLISGKQFKRQSNIFLAILILIISILNIKNGLRDAGIFEIYPFFEFIPVSLTIVIPIALYYFVQFLIYPNYHFSKKERLLLIPIIIQIIHQIVGFGLYFLNKDFLLNHRFEYWYTGTIFETISIIASFVVLIIIIRQLNSFQLKLYENYSNIEDKSLEWLKYTCSAVLVICGLWAIPTFSELIGIQISIELLYPLWFTMSLIIYWIGYSMFFRKDIFEDSSVIENADTSKSNNELSIKTDEHYERLLQLMKEEKLYNDPNLSMTILAEKTGLSNGYLSQIINQKEGKNFFDFINKYRVNEVKLKLKDPKFDHYSILGIGLEAGFKSKSTFNAVFKKMTGQTPSTYRKGK